MAGLPRVAAILQRIAADVDELARARRAADLGAAGALPDRRAERRRRAAGPDLDFREFCCRNKLPRSERSWDLFARERYRRGETDTPLLRGVQPVPPSPAGAVPMTWPRRCSVNCTAWRCSWRGSYRHPNQAGTSSSAVAPVRARTARESKSKRKHGPPAGTTFYFTLHRSRWRGCSIVRQTAARPAARSRVPPRETAPGGRTQRPRRRAAGFAHQEAHRRPGPVRLCWGRRDRLDPVDVRIAPGLSRWRRAGRWCRRVPLGERAREVQASGR